MKKNQKGFSVVGGLIVLVVVCVIGGTGWYIWQSRDKSTQQATNKAEESKEEVPEVENNSSEYLEIKDWNVKVRLGDANPNLLSYKYYETSVSLYLKSSVTNNVSCRDLGIGISKTFTSKISMDGDPRSYKKLGDYTYVVKGSPFGCGDERLDSIRKQYTGNNPYDWEYSIIH